MSDKTQDLILRALSHRAANGGRHLHHRDCIHNLPSEEQVRMRGRTVEWWQKMIGLLPEQITSEQWEIESPFSRDQAFGADA